MNTQFNEVYCSRNLYVQDRISELKGGKLYYIQLVPDMYNYFVTSEVAWTIDRTIAPPINDQCSGAITINPTVGVQWNASVDVQFATSDALAYPDGFTCTKVLLGPTIWYKYVHSGGITEIIHQLSSIDRALKYYMFTGDSCNATSLQCVGEFTAFTPEYLSYISTFTVEQPTTYWFAVELGLYNQVANFTVKIDRRNLFRWVDAGTDKVISQSIDLASYTYGEYSENNYVGHELYTARLNIDAYFQPELKARSARVAFTNPNLTRCENLEPFSIFGDTNGNYHPARIPLGNHTVRATPILKQDVVVLQSRVQRFALPLQ